MIIKSRRILGYFMIAVLIFLSFQSCDFIESKRKQRDLQTKIDSLKAAHNDLTTELKSIDSQLSKYQLGDTTIDLTLLIDSLEVLHNEYAPTTNNGYSK